jgi:hypothetical protein
MLIAIYMWVLLNIICISSNVHTSCVLQIFQLLFNVAIDL